MQDVLCIYYSRTGNTKKVMEAIAEELDAELLELTGRRGPRRPAGLAPQRPGRDAAGLPGAAAALRDRAGSCENYRLVIIGHAGVGRAVQQPSCAAFLKAARQGAEHRWPMCMTRGSKNNTVRTVYRQMDQSIPASPTGRRYPCAVGHVGQRFLAGGVFAAGPGAAGGGAVAALFL